MGEEILREAVGLVVMLVVGGGGGGGGGGQGARSRGREGGAEPPWHFVAAFQIPGRLCCGIKRLKKKCCFARDGMCWANGLFFCYSAMPTERHVRTPQF